MKDVEDMMGVSESGRYKVLDVEAGLASPHSLPACKSLVVKL